MRAHANQVTLPATDVAIWLQTPAVTVPAVGLTHVDLAFDTGNR